MTRRLETIEEVFHAALECDPKQRSAFLDERCGRDEALRREVEQLLVAHGQAENFIEIPVADLAANISEKGVSDSFVGHTIGHYEIMEEIGRGGMGVIYRARQRYSQRIVALKRVLSYQANSEETLARFRREAEAAASLDHPNILPIYEVSETEGGVPFFSMKLATGGSLRVAAPALRGKTRECVALIAKVARAIAYAHAQGILHRDLQPGNILLDARGEPLVSDFGLAKWLDQESDLTRTLTTFGTPGYIAPEQAEGANFSAAADVYSLGAVLFSLLAGRPPFVGTNALSVIRQAMAAPAPKLRSLTPSIGRDLETICARCLERDPNARYPTAAALAEDLERWRDGRPIVARPVRAPTRVWRSAKRNPKLATATVAAVCFAMAAAFLFFIPNRLSTDSKLGSRRSTSIAQVKTIAVLPFKMLTSDGNDEYLSLGLVDTLITQIGSMPQILVRPTDAVQRYAGTSARDPVAAGRELRVEAVVDGTVEREGGILWITARLLRVNDGAVLWSGKFSEQANLLGVQDAISQEVAKALIDKLSAEDRQLLTKRHTDSPEAFRAYLKGRYFWNKRTPADLQQSLSYFRQAIDLDPAYASAYAGLADAYALLVWQDELPQKEISKAKAAASKALEIDPTLAEPHASLAFAQFWYDWDFASAAAEFPRAIELNPDYATARHWYGEFLVLLGRFEEGLKELRLAQEIDPLSPIINADLGKLFVFARQPDDAITQLEATLKTNPDFPLAYLFLALAYNQKGLHDRAIAALQPQVNRPESRTIFRATLGFVYGQSGRRDEAARILNELKQRIASGKYCSAFEIALVCLGLGQKEEAMDWLDKAKAEHDPFLIYIKTDPNFDPLRGEPRFEQILASMGF